MPETLFLHIESRDRSASRVLELPGDSIRIGRGTQCEVRLGEPSLAEVECLLRRRGQTWHVQPLGPPGRISIDGRAVDHLRALAAGVPLRVGDYHLTLRPTASAATGFRQIEIPIPVSPSPVPRLSELDEDEIGLQGREYSDPTRTAARPAATLPRIPTNAPISAERSRTDLRTTWQKAKHDERVWEARWRAAGQNLRSRQGGSGVEPATVAPATRPTVDLSSPSIVPFPNRQENFVRLAVPDGMEDAIAEGDEVAESSSPDALISELTSPEIDTSWISVSPLASPESVVTAFTESAGIGPEAVSQTTATIADAGSNETMIRDPQVRSSEVPGPGPEANPPTRSTERDAPVQEASVPQASASTPPAPPRRPRPVKRPASRERTPTPKVEPPLPDVDDLEWPSARVILAAHDAATRRSRRTRSEGIRAKIVPRQSPTEGIEPAQWSVPFWLGWLPTAAAFLLLGTAGVYLSWIWGQDSREAGLLADRLLRKTATATEKFSDAEVNPEAAWWRTTGGHIALKAAALGGTRGDAARDETIAFLLDSARKFAPLEPSTRLARAQKEGAAAEAASALGLSRDTVALALTGRRLAREGKVDAALAAYRRAMELVVQADFTRSRTPVFLDLSAENVKRFALPYEDLIAAIVRDMAEQTEWTFARWSGALPDHGLVLLATYRVLVERQSGDADGALDRLVAAEAISSGSPVLHAAARAEGLAAKGRLEDAASLYRDAIAAMPDDWVRRTWWLNLGEILARGDDATKATDALMSARAGRGDDEIGHRVAQAMARQGLGATTAASTTNPKAQRLKAN
ncbi:MAG: hypothetical protein JWN86_2415 [Planctomycetota bacterium]|nr:hypothetical protein [Planctomycetota bacterium]